jgi:hypothetical protein
MTGPITGFVMRHYYTVDGTVTLVLGILALLGLSAHGRPPESTAWWGAALTLGVGLGLLTNSELITKVRGT